MFSILLNRFKVIITKFQRKYSCTSLQHDYIPSMKADHKFTDGLGLDNPQSSCRYILDVCWTRVVPLTGAIHGVPDCTNQLNGRILFAKKSPCAF